MDLVRGKNDWRSDPKSRQTGQGRRIGELSPYGLAADAGDPDHQRLTREGAVADQERQLDVVANLKPADRAAKFDIIDTLSTTQFIDILNLYEVSHPWSFHP